MDRLAAMGIFVSVIDTGSFSTTARRYDIGQPAVSKAIAQLEEWLEVKLLLRTTRALKPTEAGSNFYQRAKRTIEETDEAVLAVRDSARGLSGRLKVTAAVCLARLHIVPHLPEFMEKHPKLDLELVLDDRRIDLIEEGIDLALRTGPLSGSAMTSRKIGQSRRRVIGTPEYFRKNGVPKEPADLLAHRLVAYTRDGGGEDWTFTKGASEVSVKIQSRLRITASEGVRAAVFAGLGATVASDWAFTPELKSGLVVAVMDDWQLPSVTLAAVYPTGKLAAMKAREFAAFVENCLANE